MGIFDDFTVNDRKRTVDYELNSYQTMLYALLLQIGVDPEEFDADAWDEPLDMETPRGRVRHYANLIETLHVQKAALNSDE